MSGKISRFKRAGKRHIVNASSNKKFNQSVNGQLSNVNIEQLRLALFCRLSFKVNRQV